MGSPGDALASAANYLRASGWRRGVPWGFEVRLPEGFDFSLAAPDTLRPSEQWRAVGVEAVVAAVLPADAGPLELILPSGASGPAFLVFGNFNAILRYNRSTSYAIAVGHLADRLAGGEAFAKPWPADDVPLNRAEREEFQRLLAERSFEPGGIDGILGTQTKSALRAFQRSRGMPADGHPSAVMLARLRDAAK